MRKIWVRPVRPADQKDFNEYVAITEKNEFDPEVLTYPSTTMLVAHDGKPVVFLPVQLAVVLESLAIRPDASDFQVSVALKELVSVVSVLAAQRQLGEMYFIGTNERTNAFATKNGFTELPWKVYRLKLSDLEKPHEDLPKSGS